MKKIIAITALVSLGFAASAQNQSNQDASATQTTNLVMSNAIEITFTGNNSATGDDVRMEFNTPNDYANGVESTEQGLKVRSNKDFSVSVKYDPSSFTYVGNGTPNLNNIPSNAFRLKVTQNGTGGNIKAPFNSSSFTPINHQNKQLIINGDKGGDQTFAVKYKCIPGFGLPAGTYSIDVVYTATQQ